MSRSADFVEVFTSCFPALVDLVGNCCSFVAVASLKKFEIFRAFIFIKRDD